MGISDTRSRCKWLQGFTSPLQGSTPVWFLPMESRPVDGCVSMPCSCLTNLPVLGIQVKSKWGERVFGWYDTVCVAYTKHPHLWSQQDLGYLQTINCFLCKDSMKHEGKNPTFLKSSSRLTLGWNFFLLHNSTVSCTGRDGIEMEQFFI